MFNLPMQLKKIVKIATLVLILLLSVPVCLHADETESVLPETESPSEIITPIDISELKVVLENTCFDYTGKPVKPNIIIDNLERDIDYEVSYKNNVYPGTADIVITGLGEYTGMIECHFMIRPYAPTKVTATLIGHDDVKLTWSSVKGASGYYVYYKQASKSGYTYYGNIEACSININNLYDHVSYDFKVVPYCIDDTTGSAYNCLKGTTARIMTKKDIKAPTTVKSYLYGYDDVKISWSKVEGAKRYYVYYKKQTASSYKLLGYTTKRYYKKANLTDGTEYVFLVKPAYKVKGKYYVGYYGKSTSIYTLAKLSLKIERPESKKIDLNWDNINGVSGYQISKSTSKSKTKVAYTIKSSSADNKTISPYLNKRYYYKVRAYKVSNGKRVYGPWSDRVSYTLGGNYYYRGVRIYKSGGFLDMRKESGQKLYGYDVFQGSCTDGTYGYYILYNKSLEKCRIAKLNLSTNKVVKVSDVLNIHHGNDLTYNNKTKKILAMHLTDNPKKIAVIDAETLKHENDIIIKMTKTLEGITASKLAKADGFNAIAYDKKNDRYVLRVRGTGDYLITDGNLNPVKYVSVDVKKHSKAVYAGIDVINGNIASAQAAGTSGGYNLIMLHDWNGNYIGTLNIHKKYELESIFNVNGNVYAAFYHQYYIGKKLFRKNYIYKFKY